METYKCVRIPEVFEERGLAVILTIVNHLPKYRIPLGMCHLSRIMSRIPQRLKRNILFILIARTIEPIRVSWICLFNLVVHYKCSVPHIHIYVTQVRKEDCVISKETMLMKSLCEILLNSVFLPSAYMRHSEAHGKVKSLAHERLYCHATRPVFLSSRNTHVMRDPEMTAKNLGIVSEMVRR